MSSLAFSPPAPLSAQAFSGARIAASPASGPSAAPQRTLPQAVAAEPSTKSPPSGAAYLPPGALEKAQTGSKHEKMKLAKCGSALWTEVHELQAILRAGDVDFKTLDADDIETRLKWAGLFHRKKRTPGKFMMRLKIPGGIIRSDQVRYCGDVLKRYGKDGCVDITTRMNLQLRGVELTEAADIVDGLYNIGLTSLMSGMDNVRNMVGSPIAGIDPHEQIDTRQLTEDINNMITNDRKGRPDLTNLPRKFNIAVSGSRDDFAHTHINDIGLVPMANPARGGEMGFNVHVGGFFSIKRNEEALDMDTWLPVSDVVAFCEAVLIYFRDNGDRKNRQASRLMYMIDQWGIEGFRDSVAKQMGRTEPLERAAKPGPEYDTPWERRDITGVHAQKQWGLSWVCANVPAGRLETEDMAEFADIADKYSGGEIRLTVDQNVLFPNVKNDDLDAMLAEPIFAKFKVKPGNVTGGLVSCTGAQFCGFALIETKNRSIELASILDKTVSIPRPIRVHWTGCKNSCGQVQVADIGLMGGPAKSAEGKAVEGVDIYLGGKIGETTALGTMIEKGVPCDPGVLVPKLQALLVEHFNATILEPAA
jgi:ferredoxin-nitrite reductase